MKSIVCSVTLILCAILALPGHLMASRKAPAPVLPYTIYLETQQDNSLWLHPKSRLGLMPPAYGAPVADQASLAALGSSGLYGPASVYANGSWPEAAAAGEWTGDGRLDAALATSFDFAPASDRHLHLFDQTATGTLTHTAQLPTGAGPMAVARGDLNRDGLHDLAVINKEDDTLGLFIQSAPGTIGGMITHTTGTAPDAVAVGDFNTDLYQDIAVGHAVDQSVAIYHQQPGATFADPISLPVDSGGFNELAAGDLNSDGYDDLVLLRGAGQTEEHVAIFYQQDGSLGTLAYLTVETGGFQAHGLAVGDVTGDGRDDVVVTAGGNTPNTYLNVFPQQPDGTMAATPTVYTAYHLPGPVEIGDVNHDGRNDVVVVHDAWLSLSTYLQNAGGTLDAYVSDSLPYNDYYRPGALALADVSGDGALDVLIASHSSLPSQNGLVVLTNTTGTAPISAITVPALGDRVTDLDVTTYLIQGTASADAVTLEISTDGGLTWHAQAATTSWSYTWSIPAEDGSYIILSRATDASGRVQSPPARTRIIVERQMNVYLPLVMNGYVGPGPDLVVESLVAGTDDVQVVVKNQGDQPVVDEFWVDVYINPDPVPNTVNQTWQIISDEGLVWGVEADALPLQPGDTLTLTVGGDYYWPSLSQVSWPLTSETAVYAQVDSARAGSSYGAVLENHETAGTTYNNISGPMTPTSDVIDKVSIWPTFSDKATGIPSCCLPARP